MLKKSNVRIGISLSENLLKIVQLKGHGSSVKVVNVYSKNVSGVKETDLPKTIITALSGFAPKKADAYCVIPSNMITTKNIEIPSVNEEEIKSIVSLQAGRHTPFARDEIQVGYVNIGVYKSNYTKILLVIANKGIIKQQLSIFEKAGLKIKKVLFSPEGISRFYSEGLNLTAAGVPTGIIDIGKEVSNFIITFKGVSITSRSIPVGMQLLESQGSTANPILLDELSKTIESYKSDDIEPVPANFIITSEDTFANELQPLFNEKLGTEVTISSYVNLIKASGSVLKKIASSFADCSFLDVIAATVTADDVKVNLLPDDLQLQKSIEAQAKEVFRTAILGFVCLICVASIIGTKIFFRNSFYKKLVDDYRSSREEVVELDNISLRTKIVNKYIAGRMVSLDSIVELYENVPNNIYLSSVNLDADGNINILGMAENTSHVFNLGTTFRESDFFKSVNIKSTTAKKDRGKDASAFEIVLILKSSSVDVEDDNLDKEE